MTRTSGAPMSCRRSSRFWGLGCPKIFHEIEDSLVGDRCVAATSLRCCGGTPGDQGVRGTNELSKIKSILGTRMSQNLSRDRRLTWRAFTQPLTGRTPRHRSRPTASSTVPVRPSLRSPWRADAKAGGCRTDHAVVGDHGDDRQIGNDGRHAAIISGPPRTGRDWYPRAPVAFSPDFSPPL